MISHGAVDYGPTVEALFCGGAYDGVRVELPRAVFEQNHNNVLLGVDPDTPMGRRGVTSMEYEYLTMSLWQHDKLAMPIHLRFVRERTDV